MLSKNEASNPASRHQKMEINRKLCRLCEEDFNGAYVFCPKCGGNLEALKEQPAPPTNKLPLVEFAEELTTELRTVSHSSPAVSSPLFSSAGRSEEPEAVEFGLTLVEEKNGKRKNALLLGSLVLMLTLSFGTFIYSMFNLSLGVGEIDTGELIAFVPELEPTQFEQEEPEQAEDDGGGGGGGGGKNEDRDASSGRLASQSPNPVNQPAPMPQLTNPELPVVMETQGNNQRPITAEPLGIPGALSGDPSSGRGSGGGIGDGRGTGIGGGRGTGEGNGIGSGSGSGVGDGDGDGDGDGPPRMRTGPTAGVKILSKPRAPYTDSARQQNIQGKVILRVTFQSNGQIGAITPVSGLPGGLTERAIAAARGITFEPAMKNGVPYSVTRTIEYSFTIY